MRIISDLHIHSRFARACSKNITVKNLEKWGRIKGIDLLGTGDFTHPEWLKELKQELQEDNTGILKTRNGFNFMLTSEISLMYSQDGKGRRIHILIFAPNFETVDKINTLLLTFGRLDYDGRPIFGIPANTMVKALTDISKDIEIVPAHIWTPWFSLFGSKSGFDKIEDCFKEQTNKIHALETGLSSDPEMNWTLSSLDKFNLVSFSDSHSFWPWRLGREATIFDFKELSYSNIINALRAGKGLKMTIEVDPCYGKYHFDGHRNCNIVLNPKESRKHNNVCPVCKKPLTIGVLNRVQELADEPEGRKKPNSKLFLRLLPLHEVISHVYHFPLNSKKTWDVYNELIKKFGNEYKILLDATEEELHKETELADVIMLNRQGKIQVKPGYDGVYGVPIINNIIKKVSEENITKKKIPKTIEDFKKKEISKQKALNDFLN